MELNRINVYVEGVKQEVDGNSADDKNTVPRDTMAAYIIRLVKELLSPNKQSEHECGATCKKTFAIVIGRTNTVCCMVPIDKAVPR